MEQIKTSQQMVLMSCSKPCSLVKKHHKRCLNSKLDAQVVKKMIVSSFLVPTLNCVKASKIRTVFSKLFKSLASGILKKSKETCHSDLNLNLTTALSLSHYMPKLQNISYTN